MDYIGKNTDIISNKNERSETTYSDPSRLDQHNSNKLTDWNHEPSLSDLKEDLEYARQENRDQTTNVDGWIALRDATGAESGNKNTLPGRSKVQPKLIRKNNEWRYPGLSEPFLNTDRMFQVSPRTYEDPAAAKQNEQVLNWQFDTKLDKVNLIDRYVRRTVDEGTCIFRVGWIRHTEKVKVKKPVYSYFELTPGEDEEQLQILAMATQAYTTEDPQYEDAPDELKAAVEYSAEKGIPVYAVQTGEEEVYEDKITCNKPEIKIVNVRNLFVDPGNEGVWQDSTYFIHTYESTKSDLLKRKIYKNLDKVNWAGNAIKSKLGDPDHVSLTPQIDTRTNIDKLKILVYEYWGEYDIHGNGVMTPIVVTWIGDTIIQMEENPFPDRKPPFVIVPYMPILDSSFGEADASLLQDNQRILGAVTRGMIDLLGRSANAQTGYAKGFLDPVNRKRFINGEDFEYNPNGSPKDNLQQMTYPEIPNAALNMHQLQNAEAEGLTGVKAFSGGITGETYGQVARGITGALNAADQRQISILRRLVEGMKLVGQKIIAMNHVYLEEKEIVRVTNKEFVEIKRKDLVGNYDLKIDISTQAMDEAKAQDLGFMLQTQGPNMDPGMQSLIFAEIADLKRMPDFAERIRNYKPEPDPLEVKRRELELRELEADIMLKEAKAIEARARAENISVDTELDATGTSHERAIETAGAQARGNRNLEITKNLLEGTSPVGNIEAAVGYNELTNAKDSRATDLPTAPNLPEEQLNTLQTNNNIGIPQVGFPR
jgi:hypothetical protein